jgi:tRNA (cytosine38-C5)-methyltransferase
MQAEPLPLRVLEFYSGIGGMRSALEQLRVRGGTSSGGGGGGGGGLGGGGSGSERLRVAGAVFVGAHDVSTAANQVYALNYPPHRASQKPIESLSAGRLDALGADVWLMSPPCQPYTRQRSAQRADTRDIRDRRAGSFTHLTAALPQMGRPPACILLENVIGFEASESCAQWLAALRQCGYAYAQFHLSPTQFGVPNARPRYFCIARRRSQSSQSNGGAATASDAGGGGGGRGGAANAVAQWWEASTRRSTVQTSLESWRAVAAVCPQCSPAQCWEDASYYAQAPRPLREYLHNGGEASAAVSKYLVPRKTLEKPSSWCADLVCPSSTRSGCFTKSYASYLKGTGSLVVMEETEVAGGGGAGGADNTCDATVRKTRPEDLMGGSSSTLDEMMTHGGGEAGDRPAKRAKKVGAEEEGKDDGDGDDDDGDGDEAQWFEKFGPESIRYFMPSEIAKLLGFAPGFVFPSEMTRKKQYALLGNSLHVGTVSRLLHILLSDKL